MKRYLIIVGLIILINHPLVYSQPSDYIKGRVIDSKTSEPVSFAAVHLKNSQVGVYTNAEGDFRILNIPEFQSDSLIITCLGFHRLSIAFRVLKSSDITTLKLAPNTYVLNEVMIKARKKRLSPDMIIARALQNIKKNYPDKPFDYVSYYRDYQKDSINYLNLNESIIQTLDKGFACSSDSNRYRLIEFRKNIDFLRMFMTSNYEIPGTDNSDIWDKRLPHAKVGDQYGNELFILMVHDAIRNFDKRSFSFVETLSHDFIRNHRFLNPVGIYDESTLLYRIDFSLRQQIASDTINAKGAIFIEPDNYSIHRLEYSASYLNSNNEKKEIFSVETEYGHTQTVDSKMCLKYISFNNTFTIPDSTDTNFFKVVKSEWRQLGGPYDVHSPIDMTIVAYFNRKIDPVSAGKTGNYNITLGERIAKITHIQIDGDTSVFLTVRDDKYKGKELASCKIEIKNLKDINGNILDKRRDREFRQFRELFVQEYNKPLEFKNNCFIQSAPLEQNCISISDHSGRFWMNTPLKTEEKEEEK